MAVFLLVLTILGSIAGLSISFYGVSESDRKTKVKTLMAVASVFTITSGILQFESAEHNERDLKIQIASLNRNVTGDGWCYVRMTFADGGTTPMLDVVRDEGSYPIFDVRIEIRDLNLTDELVATSNCRFSRDDWLRPVTQMEIGTLSPHYGRDLGPITTTRDQIDLQVFIYTRGATMRDMLHARKSAGVWRVATRVDQSDGKGGLRSLLSEGELPGDLVPSKIPIIPPTPGDLGIEADLSDHQKG